MRNWVKTSAPTLYLGIAILLVVGETVCFALLIPALGRITDQAEAGERARQRQGAVAPTACKMAQDSYVRGVITRSELETYAAGALTPCTIPRVP